MKSNIKIRLERKIQDCWLGVFWQRGRLCSDIWICLIPCLPIHITLWRVECPRCGALVKTLGKDSTSEIIACCIHCAWNHLGCRCRFGQLGVAEEHHNSYDGSWAAYHMEDDE